MRSRLPILTLALFAFAFAGCDSADELLADSERIVGEWELVGIADSGGDRSVLLAGFDEVSVRFESDLVYDLFVDFASVGGFDAEQRYGGNYTVVPATRFVTLTAEIEGTPTPVPFAYEFDGDDRVGLSADSALLEPLLTIAGQELPLEGEVTLTFARGN